MALFGLVICGIGIGHITADVLENNTAAIVPQQRITTTTVIDFAVTEPETTTTTLVTATTASTVEIRRPVPRKIHKPVQTYSASGYGYGGRR
jgi:hypothetical protein